MHNKCSICHAARDRCGGGHRRPSGGRVCQGKALKSACPSFDVVRVNLVWHVQFAQFGRFVPLDR